jgi:hypothetical protein
MTKPCVVYAIPIDQRVWGAAKGERDLSYAMSLHSYVHCSSSRSPLGRSTLCGVVYIKERPLHRPRLVSQSLPAEFTAHHRVMAGKADCERQQMRVLWPCSVPELGHPNYYSSNSFVFGKNCPNFD